MKINRKIGLSLLCPILFFFPVEARADSAFFRLKSTGPSLSTYARVGDKIAGHKEVIENLRARATASQVGFVARLEDLKSKGLIESYKRFWIANLVYVSGSPEALDELAGGRDVESVFENIPVALIEPVAIEDAARSTTAVETGVRIVKTPEVWRIGLDGAGSLVCNFDTGVFGNHPALMSKYRGNNGGTASECWFDPYTNTTYPIDNNGHGTHTMGTMVGSTGTDTVGVAPGAQWIAAGVVDRGGGIQRTIADILLAFEWAADPDGDPSTTDDVPDVVNNSWGIPLGYYSACDRTFWDAVDNLEAAGVVCLFAAGNEGPYSGTIRTPADRITTDYNCFSVGAINPGDPLLSVASFSSRGPSGCDGVTIKPEVTAPGVGIRSASRTGGYVSMSGTSMATPHVSGAVAILRQFNPSTTPAQIKEALMFSARDLGTQGEDNNYGWGVIDIRKALYFMPPPVGIFPVVVSVNVSGNGIVDPGETFGLDLVLENLGRPTSNINVSLASLHPNAQVLTGSINVGFFDHIDTITVGSWNVSVGQGFVTGDRIPFRITFAYGGQTKTLDFNITVGGDVYPGTANHDNGSLSFGFSNIGQFGLGDGSANPMGAAGFRFPTTGPDFLRNGSLLLATDSYRVSDGAYSSSIYITDNDFEPLPGGYPRLIEPGLYSDQDGFAVYSDDAAEFPIGLSVTQRSFCFTGSNAYPFVITEFTITNSSGDDIPSLYIGLFCDWDLPLSSGNDDIVGYIDYESLGYVSDLSTGVSVGIKAITSPASSYAAIDNYVDLTDGFTSAEKFNFMTSGFQNVSYGAPGNYSHLLTVGPYQIPNGESEVAAFSFVAGNNLNELITNASISFLMYPNFTGVSSEQTVPESYELITNYPNPFNGSTIIEFSGFVKEGQSLEIYDIAGRLVKSIPLSGGNSVVWDGTDRSGNDVSAGIYFARVTGNNTAIRKMLYLK
ncbi:MAG: S8 family peptidase [Candidatus Zixiibacteriota bacterium]|nr:MAG: S8 family peptidase [candidate division Zixibacteria bacterium]